MFPTIGQMDCLEEVGGTYCAATYECSEGFGELWGDLPNHNGRRAIGVDSPVARQRNCVITIDGKAEFRWFVGFAPDGRDGELKGLAVATNARSPIVRVEREAEGGNLLDFILGNYEIDLGAVLDDNCGRDRDSRAFATCAWSFRGHLVKARYIQDTPLTRCVVQLSYLHARIYFGYGERDAAWSLLGGRATRAGRPAHIMGSVTGLDRPPLPSYFARDFDDYAETRAKLAECESLASADGDEYLPLEGVPRTR